MTQSQSQMDLPNELFSVLQTGVPAFLITVDENGYPHTAFTYAATLAKDFVAFVVDEKSTTEKNVMRTQKASVQILADGNCVYLLKGSVRLGDARLKHSPAPARRAVMELSSVKNQAWVQIRVAPLTYDYSERAQEWVSQLPHLYVELRDDR